MVRLRMLVAMLGPRGGLFVLKMVLNVPAASHRETIHIHEDIRLFIQQEKDRTK
jgi:hypothetical protein